MIQSDRPLRASGYRRPLQQSSPTVEDTTQPDCSQRGESVDTSTGSDYSSNQPDPVVDALALFGYWNEYGEYVRFEYGYYGTDGSFISFEFNEYGYWDDLGSFYAWEAGYHTFLPTGFFDSSGIFLEADGELEELQGLGEKTPTPATPIPEDPPEPEQPVELLGKRLTTQPVYLDLDITAKPPELNLKKKLRGRIYSVISDRRHTELREYIKKMVSKNGVEMCDIVMGKTRMNNCFLASHFVTWMTTQMRLTCDEAMLAGKDLQSLGYFVPTGKKYAHLFEFCDDDTLYFTLQMPDSLLFNAPPKNKSENRFKRRYTKEVAELEMMRQQEEMEIPVSVKWDWAISIWSEETADKIHLPYSSTSVTIEYGCLNEILKYLTLELDFNLVECFIITYKKFVPPRIVLAKLQERFQVPPTVSEKDKIVIQSRVVNFISHWLDMAPTDWDGDLVDMLEDFLVTVSQQRETGLYNKLKKSLDSVLEGAQPHAMARIMKAPPKITIPRVVPTTPIDCLMTVPPLEIARQMTLMDWKIFWQIKPSEFLNEAWLHPHLQYRATNILKFIHSFNCRAYWVTKLVLSQSSLKDRTSCIGKLIEVAKELLEMNNFHSCKAILSGLAYNAVYRLKYTWRALKRERQIEYEELSKLLDHQFSYRFYRNKLAQCIPPAIPHIGIFLTELVFISEKHADVIDGNLVNFSKCGRIFSTISQITRYQREGYHFRPLLPIKEQLLATDTITGREEAVMDISFSLEPRNFEPK